MDQQIFQIVMVFFGVLLSIIGFLGGSMLKNIKDQQQDNSLRIETLQTKIDDNKREIDAELKKHMSHIGENTRSINDNSGRIKANGEKDAIIRSMLEQGLERLEGTVKTLTSKFEENTQLLQKLLQKQP